MCKLIFLSTHITGKFACYYKYVVNIYLASNMTNLRVSLFNVTAMGIQISNLDLLQ